MMRKIAMILGMLLISSTCVFAMPDRVEKIDAGFRIGGLLPENGNLNDAAYFSGSASYGVTDWFAVGIEGGYGDAGTSFKVGNTTHDGKIGRIPLFVDLIFRYNKLADYNTVPYGIIGLGGLFTDVHGTGTFTAANLKLEADSAFATKFGLGVDWFVNEKWALNFEASYVWATSDAKVKNRSNGNIVDSAGMDYWTLEGGIKYLFD